MVHFSEEVTKHLYLKKMLPTGVVINKALSGAPSEALLSCQFNLGFVPPFVISAFIVMLSFIQIGDFTVNKFTPTVKSGDTRKKTESNFIFWFLELVTTTE